MKIFKNTFLNLYSSSSNSIYSKFLINLKIQNFASGSGKTKSIYSKNKNKNSEFNDENTIDITESQKEADLNMKLELKNLEKYSK